MEKGTDCGFKNARLEKYLNGLLLYVNCSGRSFTVKPRCVSDPRSRAVDGYVAKPRWKSYVRRLSHTT